MAAVHPTIERVRAPRRTHRGEWAGVVAACVLGLTFAAVGAWRIARWWNAPAPVPDHATTFSAAQQMLFAGATTLGQRVQPRLDGFAAVDIILAAESPGLPGDVHLEVRESANGPVVRTGAVAAASVPAGTAWDVRPGAPRERWVTFSFQPITNSAGKDYFLVLSYPPPGGVDRPGSRLATLAGAPTAGGTRPLSVNGNEASAELLVRLTVLGTRGAAVQIGLANLARVQPIGTGTLTAPAVGVTLALCFGGALVAWLARGGR